MPKSREKKFEYDVCLSFAGEDRHYVSQVAANLRENGIRVFYDEYEEVALWGKDLYEHLHEVYSTLGRFCVIFISKQYGRKLWTSHERKSAQERAFKEHMEYILPARFDNTQLPGMRDTIGYVSLRDKTPEALAEMVSTKLGARQRHDYFPPYPDRLLEHLPLNEEVDSEIIIARAFSFFEALKRTTELERKVLFALLLEGCPADLPSNIHMNLDLLARITGVTPIMLKRTIGKLDSLGFSSKLRRDHSHGKRLAKQEFIEIEFDSLGIDFGGPATEIAVTMVGVAATGYCPDCSIKALMNLDFGQLSSVTYESDSHKKPQRSKR